jgi:predicted nucleic acid-binding protein
MIVVADSSPLIVLVNIGQIQILPALFATVIIPPQIAAELSDGKRPQPVRDFITVRPGWLTVQAPAVIESIPEIHEGEQAAISLATELQADLLLIDEMDGRAAALARNLAITGTIGILERAAECRLLDLSDAFARIKKTDFWISAKLLDAELDRFRQQQREWQR